VIDAAARLRGAGLRVTRTRLELLGLLDDPGGHRSADELVAASRSRGTPVPRATVFHILGALERAGLVLVADAGPGRMLYESAANWHHHLICRACGIVVDVPCLRGEKPCLEPDLPGVRVDEAQVVFRGLCAACAAREDTAEPCDLLASAPDAGGPARRSSLGHVGTGMTPAVGGRGHPDEPTAA
jgi:Fur family ferric uptake transcriptional regulator